MLAVKRARAGRGLIDVANDLPGHRRLLLDGLGDGGGDAADPLLPPISVLMTHGFGLQFLLNVVLTILFVMPGSFHALWLLLRDR